MFKKILLLIIISLTIKSYSQNLIDTLITFRNDTIVCQVSYVNSYTVFYKYKKKKRYKNDLIPRIDLKYMAVNTKNIRVQKLKIDSTINDYNRKSILNKDFEPIRITNNKNPELRIIGFQSYTSFEHDFFILGTSIQNFAQHHKCKLIYVEKEKVNDSLKISIILYDANEQYYLGEFKKYKNDRVYFVRTINSFEEEKYTFQYDSMDVSLLKGESIDFPIIKKEPLFDIYKSDSDTVLNLNKYYYVGQISIYQQPEYQAGKLVAGVALGLLTGVFVISAHTGTELKRQDVFSKNRISPFIGEFMLNMSEESSLKMN